ncbi:MAG: hypothetical protein WA970_03345 [Gammaproteobacteria bacterium]
MENNERNMEKFNEFTTKLLSNLHDTFPVEQDIMITEYRDLDTVENSAIFFSTIKFLEKEGYISHSDQIYGGFLAVCLTLKGLAVLNSKPASISKSETLINKFRRAIKVGTAESYSTCIKELTKLSVSYVSEKITKE